MRYLVLPNLFGCSQVESSVYLVLPSFLPSNFDINLSFRRKRAAQSSRFFFPLPIFSSCWHSERSYYRVLRRFSLMTLADMGQRVDACGSSIGRRLRQIGLGVDDGADGVYASSRVAKTTHCVVTAVSNCGGGRDLARPAGLYPSIESAYRSIDRSIASPSRRRCSVSQIRFFFSR